MRPDGAPDVVRSADGTPIGILTAGAGPDLLLVHGGLTGLSRWAPLWAELTPRFRVTALDRRGRGSSGDAAGYAVDREYEDVAAVVEHLAARSGGPVDALGHSFGGVCLLGAAGRGVPLRRLALYEPPGPATVAGGWPEKVRGLVAAGRPGPAIGSFLTEIVGLTWDQVEALRQAPQGTDDVLAVASRTLPREAEALAELDLAGLAGAVRQPVLLLRGTESPPWAAEVVGVLERHLADTRTVVLPGEGHEGVDTAAGAIAGHLADYLLDAAT
jgi:pimeloyl-ACP methyl ester carboxylesterase